MNHKFTVKRSKWYRGNGTINSKLLRTDGTMCCLGFLALSCGSSPNEIIGRRSPRNVPDIKWPDGLLRTVAGVKRHTGTCGVLMEFNDDNTISNEEREERLTKIFKTLDIDVTFED